MNTKRKDEIVSEAKNRFNEFFDGVYPDSYYAFCDGAEWADKHISDETIMKVLNSIGYEESSWVEFVRDRLKNNEK